MPFDLSTAKPVAGGFDLSTAKPVEDESVLASVGHGLKKAAQGAALGVSDVGNTALNALSYLPGKLIPEVAQWNRTRNADFEAITEQNKDSMAFKGGRLAGNIAAALPVGGTLGAGARVVAPGATGLANALATSGMRAGATPGAVNMLTRMAGGGITGAASAGLVNPEDAGVGGMVGALLPPGLRTLGVGATHAARSALSLAQPFTKTGQEEIAAKILARFGEGGPMTMNANQLVPGSMPTLAEATGNAGLAGLQRTARDLRPNAFQLREQANAGARTALLDSVAGDTAKLDATKAARESAANVLYGKAATSDAMRRELAQREGVQQSALDYARRGGMGKLKTNEAAAAESILPSEALQDLSSRSTFRAAVQAAGKLAKDRGEDIGNPLTSVNGLHYVKLAMDDMLETSPTNALARNAKSGVLDTKNKLVDEIAKLSPQYDTARKVFADMSKPVDAMEALQGLRLTDAQGNITLSKVKNALDSLQRARAAPGVSPAKALDDTHMKALESIQADLLRQARLGAGRSAGSNTFQNIATDNILGTMLPGKLGGMVGGKVGDVFGQVGKLAYSGSNEKIRNSLLDMMLDPALAQSALSRLQLPQPPSRLGGLLNSAYPWASRSAPLLSNDQ